MIDPSGHLYALALAVLIGIVYLAIVRFLDLNEKEPLWALALLFVVGAISAAMLSLVVPSPDLTLNPWIGAISEQIALCIAIAAGMAALNAIGRLRGWSEVTGLMDGLVYGAAAGLGYATGRTFIQELSSTGIVFPGMTSSGLTLFWTYALSGLVSGVFGAIIGAGFGAVAYSRSCASKIAGPILALIIAIAADGGYRILRHGEALSEAGMMRTWIALLFPLALVLIVAAIALLREKQAITAELENEKPRGVVTDEDLSMLKSSMGRQIAYMKTMFTGKFARLAGLKMIHNRQVMLALTKKRLAGETDSTRRAIVEAEVEHLRSAILASRAELISIGAATAKGGVR